MNPLARGACPGIAQPMPTGDGLLARLMPPSPMSIETFVALCDASQTHGNGIMEVTQRGSLQIRGLSIASAPLFARTAAALGLGAEGRPALLASPLFGLDAQEPLDAAAFGAAMRAELTAAEPIGPKVSVIIDGGGPWHLDQVPADVRLRRASAAGFHLSMAGTAADSRSLGWVQSDQSAQAVAQLLLAIAHRGEAARARDFANDADIHALRARLAGVLTDGPPPPARARAEPIGAHRLNDGRVAQGIAPAFGHMDAPSLERVVHAAAGCGAASIRAAPGRTLLFIGLSPASAQKFTAAAGAEGWVVRPDDVRRHVIACAGAPACASAAWATRSLAPAIARAAKPLLDGSMTIHLSGCAKGCACPGAATLTFAGPGRLIVQGRAGDAPQGRISSARLIAGLGQLQAHVAQLRAEVGQLRADTLRSPSAGETSAQVIARLGARRVIESLGGELTHG